MSREQKEKCRLSHIGKKASEETKQKHRIDRLRRLDECKIPPNQDRGAKEFFEQLNRGGFDFRPTVFYDLGYIADGYDKNTNIWIEFDPPHHYYVSGKLKQKDIIRQKNIIRHFRAIGEPLKDFVRVKTNKSGTIIHEMSSVVKGDQ